MSTPKLSVCLITYNHARFVETAIKSVLSQKLNLPWEFIISDDCSNDRTQEIVRKYSAQYPELIRPIFRTRNLGSSAHLIEMLNAARGEHIAYLEGDDGYTDDSKLQTQFEYLQNHESYVGCFHDLTIVNENGETLHESFLRFYGSAFAQVVAQEDLFKSGAIGQMNSWMYRRRCIEAPPRWLVEFPLDKSLAFYLANFGNWGYIDKTMSFYRLHGGGIYSPLPLHRQNEVLLKHMRALYDVPEYRSRYGKLIRRKICHYYRELAGAHKATSPLAYLKHLLSYLRYHPNRLTALKILLAEEMLMRKG